MDDKDLKLIADAAGCAPRSAKFVAHVVEFLRIEADKAGNEGAQKFERLRCLAIIDKVRDDYSENLRRYRAEDNFSGMRDCAFMVDVLTALGNRIGRGTAEDPPFTKEEVKLGVSFIEQTRNGSGPELSAERDALAKSVVEKLKKMVAP